MKTTYIIYIFRCDPITNNLDLTGIGLNAIIANDETKEQ